MGDIRDMLKPILQETLGYVSMEVLTPFCAYHVPYIANDQRLGILGRWREVLANLGDRERLKMPDLNQFDEKFRPMSQ
jgi:NAD(P)H dehydrogenase (quinone)